MQGRQENGSKLKFAKFLWVRRVKGIDLHPKKEIKVKK